MAKHSILFARFPFGRADDPDTTDWLVGAVLAAKAHPDVGEVLHWRIDDTPITMGRNRCLLQARKRRVDYVVMVDSDMKPDSYLPSNPNRLGTDPHAVPFFQSSLDFALEHHGPCVVASPYCGPPPHENVFIFRWGRKQSEHPNVDMSLDQISREDAAMRAGFERVAALPTGLILIDMKAVERLSPPWFYYEWTDHFHAQKASTEDVTFSRDLTMAGVPIYCNWSAWSGHWKRKCVGKPVLLTTEDVSEKYREAVLRGARADERMVMVGEGRNGEALPPKIPVH